jgi:SLOG-like protein
MTNGLARPLAGCMVNLSISESEDTDRQGFPGWQVNRVTLQIVAALFGQGASLAFGHDWREDGVMEAVHGFARQAQPPVPLQPAAAEAARQPLLLNLLPWPDEPMLAPSDLERLRSTLRIEPAGLPENLQPFAAEALRDRGSPLYRYLRARGLTFLRHRLTEACDARFCLGGRRHGSSGRFPGVIEEAYLALRAGRPLFVTGLLGGASQQVVDAILGRGMVREFCNPEGLPALPLYDPPPIPEPPDTADDRMTRRERVWEAFVRAGPKGLADANALTVEQNIELFEAPALDRVIELVLAGLCRIRRRGAR